MPEAQERVLRFERLRIEHVVRNQLDVVQVSPGLFSPKTHRHIPPSVIEAVFNALIAPQNAPLEARHKQVRVASAPMVVLLPELYAPHDAILKACSRCPPGTIVIAGLLGDHAYGWFSGTKARELVEALQGDSSISFAPLEAHEAIRQLSPNVNVNLMLCVVVGTKETTVFVRLKTAPAPNLELSTTASSGISVGDLLVLLEIDSPKTTVNGAGLTILPLVCSEYFAPHPPSGRTVADILRENGPNGLTHHDAIDLVAVVNVQEQSDRSTWWPQRVESMMFTLHGADSVARTSEAITILTSPRSFSFGEYDVHRGPPATAVASSRLFGEKQSLCPPTDGRALHIRAAGSSEELTEPRALSQIKRDALVAFSGGESLPSDVEAELLCFTVELPRLNRQRDMRLPIQDVRLFHIERGSLALRSPKAPEIDAVNP